MNWLNIHYCGVVSYRACDLHPWLSANIHSRYLVALSLHACPGRKLPAINAAQVCSIASGLVVRIGRRNSAGFFYFFAV